MIPDLVLLDRDGTLNALASSGRYVVAAREARLLPGAGEAVRLLNAAGVPVVVVTNQRGLATGRLSRAQLAEVHDALTDQLATFGAHVGGWYICPHDINECDCRKPLPGLLLQALADRPGVRPERCLVIGDAESDMLAAAAAGMSGYLLCADPAADPDTVANAVHPSLLAAVTSVLTDEPWTRKPHNGTTKS